MAPRTQALLFALLVLVVDAWTKHAALTTLLPLGYSLPVLYVGEAGLRWTFAWNTGVSFSFLNDAGEAGRWGLSAVAVVAIGVFSWLFIQEKRLLSQVGIGLIIAGAAGNVIDRVRFGAVVDFIHVHYGHWHFPVFNVADSAITVGVMLLIYESLVQNSQTNKKPNK